MNPLVILRLAGVLAAVQGVAHGVMTATYRPLHGPREQAVIAAMRANEFLFAGRPRTYWGFYVGYAMMSALACLVEAVLFWQLARFTSEGARPVLCVVAATFIAFNLGHAILAARYFFPLPAIFDVLIAATLLAAFIGLRST